MGTKVSCQKGSQGFGDVFCRLKLSIGAHLKKKVKFRYRIGKNGK